MPFGAFSGRGWLFSFVSQKDKNRMKHSDPPSDLGVNLLVRGAILSFRCTSEAVYVGDCCATQGDGELSGVAIEQRATVTLQVKVIKGWTCARPGNLLVVIGSARPPEGAPRITYREPVRGISADYGFGEHNAYMLLSQAGRIRFGNMVDPKITLAASISKSGFTMHRQQRGGVLQ
jgi:acetamidase/formamidase